MHLFLVKFRKGFFDEDRGWKVDTSYPVYDVYKYMKTDKETGKSMMVTKFLVCNPGTGDMRWIESHGLLYVGS